jgi:hypothetical protein
MMLATISLPTDSLQLWQMCWIVAASIADIVVHLDTTMPLLVYVVLVTVVFQLMMTMMMSTTQLVM